MAKHLIGYVVPSAILVASTLMILGRVPPNRIFGFRTEETLSSPEAWYPANRALGWFMAAAAIASICFNLTLWWTVPEWPVDRTVSWMTGGIGIPLLIAVLLSVRHYLRSP